MMSLAILLLSHLVLSPNKPLNTQMTAPNTIYEIQSDFNLNNSVLDLSRLDNCVLKFDGGTIKNGTIKANGILIENRPMQCFDKVRIEGDVKNDSLDVRWWGIEPNKKGKDCTPIIRDYIMPANKPMVFPRGNFYFSEFLVSNKKSDNFAILGENSYGLGYTTQFYPLRKDQRYIIKVGGGANCFGLSQKGASERGYNIRLEHIAFRWLEENDFQKNLSSYIGIKRQDLTNNYNPSVKIDYPRSALILDRVEIGKFDISGGLLADIPLLTIGFIYECYFDNIIMYHNEGRSDLPIVQVINSTSAAISATIIKRIMFEALVGSLFKTYQGSSIAELVINDFFVEQSALWTKSIGKTEQRYSEQLASPNAYNRVPLFDLNGYGTMVIDNLTLAYANASWSNSFDSSSSPGKKNMRSFAKFGTEHSNYSNLYIKMLRNSGQTNFAYVEGGYEKGNQSIIAERLFNINFIPVGATNINLIAKESFPMLADDIRYQGQALFELNKSYFIKNHGYTGIPLIDNDYLVNCRYNTAILNESGFIISKNATCIVAEFYSSADPASSISIQVDYMDNDGNSIVSRTVTAQKVRDKSQIRTVSIPIDGPKNFHHISLKFVGYSVKLKSIIAQTK